MKQPVVVALVSVALCTSLAGSTSVYAAPPAPNPIAMITPQPMPVGFPVPAATTNQWIATANTSAMRGHAWAIWAGMNKPSGQIYEGMNLPIWETWYGFNEVFPPAPSGGPVTLAVLRQPHVRALREFQKPLQFHHNLTGLTAATVADDPSRIVAFNKFDIDEADFLLAGHPGPNGQTFHYNSLASLNALNSAWPKTYTGQQRGVTELPVKSIETKPVMTLVKANGVSVLPMWQGVGASTKPAHPTPATWTTCVLVDPTAPPGPLRPAGPTDLAKGQALKSPACKSYFVGNLGLFYNFRMDAAEAAAFNAAQNTKDAHAGDYAALMAMHVNTKEIPFWTWQTFYWQPGKDAGFPGDKAGMPKSLPAPWSNYATCANYDQTTTPGGKTMQVCFNPYLETSPAIPVGITSNCMSCHGTARIATDEGYPADYKAPITFFQDPKYFTKVTTHTDFSWAIPSAN